jgi:hypothetical protein
MTIGDHPPLAPGFNGRQVCPEGVAVSVTTQLYPHIGTLEPSGNVAIVAPAVKLIVGWANDIPVTRRKIATANTVAFTVVAFGKFIRIALLLCYFDSSI